MKGGRALISMQLTEYFGSAVKLCTVPFAKKEETQHSFP